MDFRRVAVSVVPDERGHMLPVSFTLEDMTVEVVSILDRWYEGGTPGRPGVAYFKIAGRDGRRFILRHATVFDAWGACEVD
jgi:hypothetical protein